LRRWALAAAVPVVLTAAVVWVGRQGEPPRDTLRIEASKQGGDVVFTITNGEGTHQVRKSDAPNERIVVRNGGSFRDDASGGPDLVFYRID
jgi:hypothetical protein